jgi:hypothetical protein
VDGGKEHAKLLLRSALTAREKGHTGIEWLSYEAMMPNPALSRLGTHVAALVWDGFLDDSVAEDEELWEGE